MSKYIAPINVRLPQALYKELKERADSNNINLSAMIRIALTEYVKQTK